MHSEFEENIFILYSSNLFILQDFHTMGIFGKINLKLSKISLKSKSEAKKAILIVFICFVFFWFGHLYMLWVLKFWNSKMICMFFLTSQNSSPTSRKSLMCKSRVVRNGFSVKRFDLGCWVITLNVQSY
jgi:hypothetical protein